MTTRTEHNQVLIAKYRAAGKKWPATSREIAAWALSTKEWAPTRETLIARCAEELARSMREEYITDNQGRRVRAKHAARLGKGEQQRTLWADIRTADPEHMEMAFKQRRHQIVGDCRQLKLDVDSYNENAGRGKQVQMDFDFTEDLAELEALDAIGA